MTATASAEEARGHLTACLQSHPELPWLYLLRGFASGQLGCEQQASRRRQRPRKILPTPWPIIARPSTAIRTGSFRYALLANRGLVRFQASKLDDAVDDLKEAIALDPRQLSAHVTLAQIHRQRHQLDLALAELGRAIALKPNLAALYRTRARWNLERPH